MVLSYLLPLSSSWHAPSQTPTDPKAYMPYPHQITNKPPKPSTLSYIKPATVFSYIRWPFSRLPVAGPILSVHLSSRFTCCMLLLISRFPKKKRRKSLRHSCSLPKTNRLCLGLRVGISTGNPGVRRANPYPYPWHIHHLYFFNIYIYIYIFRYYLLYISRGFRHQNAGLDPGWLVAAGGSKKKKGHHLFFCSLRSIWALKIM